MLLSGMGHDGTAGLGAIDEQDGVTFVQKPSTARFASMPENAEAAGVSDFVLPPQGIAEELVRLSRHPFVRGDALEPFRDRADSDSLELIFDILRKTVGIDLSEYKDTTIRRRLARRMALRKMPSVTEYLNVLRAEPTEVRALFDDILVHVTSFFREPALFEELKHRVFPEIVKNKPAAAPVRMWVAGCSTGEEVYSLAMAFLEFQSDERISVPLQVFGSDVSDRAIEKARAAVYPESAMQDVGVERTRRFFVKVEGGYRISKTVRDLCVFVRHDLARDPPFSRLDLASCRNVLIYFNPPLQKRVIATMHYCLNQPGFLVLGHTENASGHAHLFSLLDKTNKIFARSATSSSLRFPRPHEARIPLAPQRPLLAAQFQQSLQPQPAQQQLEAGPGVVDLPKHVDSLLLSQYAPAGVIVNDGHEVVQFRGRTGRYLEPAPGTPQNNLLRMVREGLLTDLRIALGRAKKEHATIRRDNVRLTSDDGGSTWCNIVVSPIPGLPDGVERLFLVLFEDVKAQSGDDDESATRGGGNDNGNGSGSGGGTGSDDGDVTGVAAGKKGKRVRASSSAKNKQKAAAVAELEAELKATKDYLQSVSEEQQRTNDELTSTNEELVSSNEELQSMNEELETAKEELQSANEELTTVNDELHNRNREMGQLNNDLTNILASVEIPLVILDRARRIRRCTPKARTLMNLVPTDIGRPIDDIRANVNIADLERVVGDVIDTMAIQQREVQDRQGRWHRIQIRPYKTVDNTIDGAILSLLDIDDLKTALSHAERAKAESEQANKAKDLFLATVSHELRTPLSAMLMQAQLIRGGTLSKQELRAAAEAIEQSAKVQVQLVEDLLDVSRMVGGRLNMEMSSVNFATVVRSAVGAAAPLADGKSIALDVRAGQNAVHVSGDFARLHQVVWNLVTNAVKFTNAGGHVVVELRSRDKSAVLRVIDDGAGIDPDFLPFVFTRFAQADGSRGTSSTSANAGLGLGLAIARHIVEMHGGSIRAESPGRDRGTTMTVPLLVDVDVDVDVDEPHEVN